MKSQAIQYNAKLQRIAREVKRDIDAELKPLIRFYAHEYTMDQAPEEEQERTEGVPVLMDAAPTATTDAWYDAIEQVMQSLLARWGSERVRMVAERIAGEFVRTSLAGATRVMRRTAGIDVFNGSPALQSYLQASAKQNAELIRSIPEEYLNRVSTLVQSNMRSGMRPSFIEKAMQEQFGVTQRKARFIARDQAGKIQGELAEKQQRGAGFSHFEWIDSSDSRVRHRHEEIANKVTEFGRGIYSWSDLPLSDKGLPIKPGQDFACRCSSRPVGEREIERNRANGLTKPGLKR